MNNAKIKNNFLKDSDKIKLRLFLQHDCSRKSFRLLVLKMLDENVPYKVISRCLFCTEKTILNIKKKYFKKDLDYAIEDQPRTGKPRQITTATEELIVATVCSTPPAGFARWTLRLIVQTLKEQNITMGKESVRIILGNRKIKPWIHKMWCIPDVTPEFIERMNDVIGMYEKLYDKKEPVVCLDEKLIMLLDSGKNRKEYVDKDGSIKQDYEYVRQGTANAFCAIESKTGIHFTQITNRRTKIDFAIFLKIIIDYFPTAKTIHIIMDNLNTHFESSLIEHFGEEEGARLWSRITPHYTPKHASWLNQAEIEIGMFQRMCLANRRFPSIEELTIEAAAWNSFMNKEQVKINWTFSREKAKAKFKY